MANQELVYDSDNKVVGVFKTVAEANTFAATGSGWAVTTVVDTPNVDVGWFVDTTKNPSEASATAPSSVVASALRASTAERIHQAFLIGYDSLPHYRAAVAAPPTGGGGTLSPQQDHFTASRGNINPLAEGTEYKMSIVDSDSSAPFSVASNNINIAAGQAEFETICNWHLDVDPNAFVSSATSGGNRLFVECYWKKGSTILEESRQYEYMRAHEGWAPGDHKVGGSFATVLTGGDSLSCYLMPIRANRSGAEVRGIQVLNSDVSFTSTMFTAGSGGGSVDTASEALRAAAKYLYMHAALADVINTTASPGFGSLSAMARATLTNHILDGISRLAHTRYSEFLTNATQRTAWANANIADGQGIYADLSTTAGAVRTGTGAFTRMPGLVIPAKFTPEHRQLT